MKQNQVVTVSINLSKIPKTEIKKASNGKLYFSCEVRSRKEVDQFGNNLNIMLPYKKSSDTAYIGNARLWNFNDAVDSDFNGYLELSVCLTDIPKEKISRSGVNLYFNIEVLLRKEKDKFGNDLAIRVVRSKEEREEKTEPIYCGNGRIVVSKYQTANDSDMEGFNIDNFIDKKTDNPLPEVASNEDDLPF